MEKGEWDKQLTTNRTKVSPGQNKTIQKLWFGCVVNWNDKFNSSFAKKNSAALFYSLNSLLLSMDIQNFAKQHLMKWSLLWFWLRRIFAFIIFVLDVCFCDNKPPTNCFIHLKFLSNKLEWKHVWCRWIEAGSSWCLWLVYSKCLSITCQNQCKWFSTTTKSWKSLQQLN